MDRRQVAARVLILGLLQEIALGANPPNVPKEEAIVTPLGGDLDLLRGEGPLRRVTETPSPEIDPKLSRDGSKVAFVRDDELHVIDLDIGKDVQLSHGSGEGLTHATA